MSLFPLPALRSAFLALACASGLHAFTTTTGSAVWPDGPIVMNLQLSPNAPLSDGQANWNAAAATQLAAWNQHLVRSTFLWVTDSTAPVGSGNLANNVLFAADNFGRAFGDSTLAVTTSFRIGTRIIEADVTFNTKYRWDSYRGPLRVAAGFNAEFSRVALHEFGHVLGLSHPDQAGQFVNAVMNSTAGDVDGLTDDDKAGAAFLYAANTGAVAPAILIPLVDQSPVRGDSVEFSVGVSGTAPFSYQWRRNNVVQGVSTASFVLSSITAASAGMWTVTVTNSRGSASSSMLLTVTDGFVAPTITTQPAAATSLPGRNVVFSVAATGSTPRLYQWRKDGANYGNSSASDTLTIADVQASDAGRYSVVVSNNGGTATSAEAVLTVSASSVAPAFTSAPTSHTVSAGSTVVFSSLATGTPTPTYQWRRNGTTISGATLPNLVLSRADLSAAGIYTCTATNSAGSATSNSATLSIAPAGTEPSRLDGLSVLTTLATGEPFFTVATVIGGAGTVGLKPLLVRASGPTLGSPSFGIPGTLPDPRLELFSPPTSLATNDNWGTPAANVPGISAAIASRAIFPFFAANSRDAAVYNSGLPAGNYTVQVGDTGGGSGLVLAEIYDAGTGAFTATTPRLVSVAVLKAVPADGLVTLGFNIGGTTAKTVLIRALGPTLGALFNLPDAMPDPRVALFAAGATTPFAGNDNWGGDAQILALNNLVTFPPASAASRDAIMVITLNRGGYTVEARPAVGSTGGSVLAEVYELP